MANQTHFPAVISMFWILVSLSMVSQVDASATGRSARPTFLNDDVLRRISTHLGFEDNIRSQGVNTQFNRTLRSDVTEDLAYLRRVVSRSPKTAVDQLRLEQIFLKHRFNEYFVMEYLKILQLDWRVVNQVIADAFNLPVLTEVIYNGIGPIPTPKVLTDAAVTLMHGDCDLDDHEKNLIAVSWLMYINFMTRPRGWKQAFDGFHIMYEFLWSRIRSLPSLQNVYDSKEGGEKLQRLRYLQEKYHLIVWHHDLRALNLYMEPELYSKTGIHIASRVFADLPSRWPPLLSGRTDRNDYLIQLFNEQSAFPYILWNHLRDLTGREQWHEIELLLSSLKENNKFENRLDLLKLRYRGNYWWMKDCSKAQIVRFTDIFVKYVESGLDDTQRIVVANNLWKMMHFPKHMYKDELGSGPGCGYKNRDIAKVRGFVDRFINLIKDYWQYTIDIDEEDLARVHSLLCLCFIEDDSSNGRGCAVM
eukprot:3056_1